MQNESEFRDELYDLQRYLMDRIPPLTAWDPIETLIDRAPQSLMTQVRSWAIEQSHLQSVSLADCLFHALKKINHLGGLGLIEPEKIQRYLTAATPVALEMCPPEEREILRSHLGAMGESEGTSTTAVTMDRIKTEAPVERAAPEGLVAKNAFRLSLVIDRLTRLLPLGGKGLPPASQVAPVQGSEPAPPSEGAAAQLVTMAASSASSEEELQKYITTLRPYTGDVVESKGVFSVLGASVPGWEINVPAGTQLRPASQVEAMHKIINLTENPMDRTRRFRELLTSAIEQFNAGSLGAAVSMLQLAEVVIGEKKLDPPTVERIRLDAAETIAPERLKKYAENKAKHPLLRKALTFFPTLTLESLFEQLRGEEKSERRRSLLGLLEAYGTGARNAALVELETELAKPAAEAESYYQRNLIYLLHRIAREGEEHLDKEIDLLSRASARGQSIYVIKEAMIPLGHIKSEAAVKILTMRLAEVEATLARNDTSQYPVDEMQKLLDRIIAALARIGTTSALLTIARHGLKPNAAFGDARGRLGALAQHDLSFDEQTVRLIVKTIREDLPSKLLGKILPSRQPSPVRLIEALSATRSEEVDALLTELVAKFPEHEIGRAGTAALESRRIGTRPAAAEPQAVATLNGDLQFFGLPSLMQSLADTQATGLVTLTSKQTGLTAGKILVSGGKFIDAQAQHLRGTSALYELLERPVVGAFAFVPQSASSAKNEPLDFMPLLFEGVRRHDELQQAMVIVPNGVSLKSTGARPTPSEEETDPGLIREVWVKATSGTPISEWEKEIAVDAYRIRKLLAHWVETGALQAGS